MKKIKKNHFTLFELAVAIAVFAIGIVTAMAILVPAVRWGAEAKTDFTAAEAAVQAVNEFNATGNTAVSNNAATDYPYYVYFTQASGANKRTVKVYRKAIDEDNPGNYTSIGNSQGKVQFEMTITTLK